MRQCVLTILMILLVLPVAAVEVPFRDGSVVEAVGYTVNGSYLMLEMANGSRLAYDVADIDLEALAQAEAAAATPQPEEPREEPATLGVRGSLRVPDATPETPSAGLTITDQHVKHISGSGIAGPEDEVEETPAAAEGPPEGYEVGGDVLLNNVSVSPLDEGQWEITGEVINRTSDAALDVRVDLMVALPDGDPWTASVGVSGILGSDEKATFSHVFQTPEEAGEEWSPRVQANVVWMKGESRLEPNYNRVAPHPSGLPVDVGGVGGADVREEVPL